MLGGGRDRKELLGYNPQGYVESDDPNKLMGCHKSMYAGLNIKNAQPGKFYAWAESSQRGLMLARLKGYHVVQSGEPESPGYSSDPDHHQLDLDTSSTGFPGVVLVRRSARDERRVRDEEQTKRSQLLRGDTAYLAQASASEAAHGGQRLRGEHHRTHVTEGGNPESPQLDAWTTDRGISS